MSRILRVTLASAMLIAGSSMAFAAERGFDGRDTQGGKPGQTPNNTSAGVNDNGRSSEQDEKLNIDRMNTGSISNCDSQLFDRDGNCVVVDPGYQDVR